MALVRQRIDLSFTKDVVPAIVHAKQYDDCAREIACRFYVQSTELSLPGDVTVNVSALRPDGQLFQYSTATDPDVVWVEDGMAVIAVTRTMSCIPGRMPVDVTVTQDDTVIGAFSFILHVQPCSVRNEALTTGSYSAVVAAVAAGIADVYINEDGYLAIESEDGLGITFVMDDEGNITIDYGGSR